MTNHNTKSIVLRGISLFVAVSFTATTLLGDPSVVLAAGESLVRADRLTFQKELQKSLYSLPSEIGSVEETSFLQASDHRPQTTEKETSTMDHGLWTADRFVVHIQDAHANPEAQRNIYEILKFLAQKYPDIAIGVEGASGPLHPEYLDLFREFPEANQAVVEDLKAKGEMTGAELFAWEKYQTNRQSMVDSPQGKRKEPWTMDRGLWSAVAGVENVDLYRENLKTYRELLFKRNELQTLLNPIHVQLEKESSRVLNPDLRAFLKERERRKEGKYHATGVAADADLRAYVRYLQKKVSKILGIDLADPIEQLRFPNLTRLALLDASSAGKSVNQAPEAWQKLVEQLQPLAKEKIERELIESLRSYGIEKGLLIAKDDQHKMVYGMDASLYPRRMLERLFLFTQKHKYSLANETEFLKSFKLLILQAEIDAPGLMQEMSLLERQLIDKLARTDAEKALVHKLENLDLLGKLLSLELTRDEYQKAVAERKAMDVFTKDSQPLKKFLTKARHFYDVASQRDRALVENSLALFSGPRSTVHAPRKNQFVARETWPVARVVVLITGGFHTDGIRDVLAEQGIGYAVLAPHISRTDHGELYQKVMADTNADLSAYFKVKNPFLTKQQAMLFKEVLETAAPVLFDKYQVKGADMAGRVQKAFAESPVLSRVVASERLQDPTILRFTPRPAGATLPQNTAIPASPITAAIDYSAAVAAEIGTWQWNGLSADVAIGNQTVSIHVGEPTHHFTLMPTNTIRAEIRSPEQAGYISVRTPDLVSQIPAISVSRQLGLDPDANLEIPGYARSPYGSFDRVLFFREFAPRQAVIAWKTDRSSGINVGVQFEDLRIPFVQLDIPSWNPALLEGIDTFVTKDSLGPFLRLLRSNWMDSKGLASFLETRLQIPIKDDPDSPVPAITDPAIGRTSRIIDDIAKAVVAVEVFENGRLVVEGSGALVTIQGKPYVMTAAHNADNLISNPVNARGRIISRDYRINLSNGKNFVFAQPVAYSAANDVLFFEIGEEDFAENFSGNRTLEIQQEAFEGYQPLIFAGYTAEDDSPSARSRLKLAWAWAGVVENQGTRPQGNAADEAHSFPIFSSDSRPGMSGSAIVNLATGKVVGVLSQGGTYAFKAAMIIPFANKFFNRSEVRERLSEEILAELPNLNTKITVSKDQPAVMNPLDTARTFEIDVQNSPVQHISLKMNLSSVFVGMRIIIQTLRGEQFEIGGGRSPSPEKTQDPDFAPLMQAIVANVDVRMAILGLYLGSVSWRVFSEKIMSYVKSTQPPLPQVQEVEAQVGGGFIAGAGPVAAAEGPMRAASPREREPRVTAGFMAVEIGPMGIGVMIGTISSKGTSQTGRPMINVTPPVGSVPSGTEAAAPALRLIQPVQIGPGEQFSFRATGTFRITVSGKSDRSEIFDLANGGFFLTDAYGESRFHTGYYGMPEYKVENPSQDIVKVTNSGSETVTVQPYRSQRGVIPRAEVRTSAFNLASGSGAVAGMFGVVSTAITTAVRSELRESAFKVLQTIPANASLAGRAVVFKRAENVEFLDGRGQLLPGNASAEERWKEAQKQYRDLLYSLRRVSTRLNRFVVAPAEQREERARNLIHATQKAYSKNAHFQSVENAYKQLRQAQRTHAENVKELEKQLEQQLQNSGELETKFRVYLEAVSTLRMQYSDGKKNYADAFFMALGEAMSLGSETDSDVSKRFLWKFKRQPQDSNPVLLKDLSTMTSSEIDAMSQAEDLKENQWLLAMVNQNRSIASLFQQHVVRKISDMNTTAKANGLSIPALEDGITFGMEILAELVKAESYQLNFRRVSEREGFILIAKDPLSPEQYRQIRAQHGNRLKGIVMMATKIGEGSDSVNQTSHTAIIIRSDFNPPALVFLEKPALDEFIARVEEGNESPLLILTALEKTPPGKEGEVGMQLVVNPEPEKRAAYDHESQRTILWENALNRWVKQSKPKVKGRFALNLIPGNLRVLDELAAEIGLAQVEVGLYRTEMQTETSTVATTAMVRALQEELKKAPVDSALQPMPLEERRREFFSWVERSKHQGQDPLVMQLAMDIEEIKDLLTHSTLRGQAVRIRTEDYRLDKNPVLYETLLNEGVIQNDKVGGYEMYYTGFGRLRLILRLAAMILANAEVQGSEKAMLEVVFPMVRDPAEIRYIQTQILPIAVSFARERILEMGGDEAQVASEVLLRGIRFGMMLETPDAVRNLGAFLEDDFLQVFNGGLNDFHLFDAEESWSSPEDQVRLERDDPWYAILVQQMDSRFLNKVYSIVKAFHDYNAAHPDHPKKLCLCGEIATDSKYAPMLADLERIYPKAGLSVSMVPSKMSENIFEREQAGRLESEGADQFRPNEQLKMVKFLTSRMKEAKEIMIVLESWQQNFERHGFFLGLHRLDPDVVEGPGSSVEFVFLKHMVRAMLDNPEHRATLDSLNLNSNEHLSRNELTRMLNYLVKRDFLLPSEQEQLLAAFDFSVPLREIIQQKRKQDPKGPYSGRLVPSLIPAIIPELKAALAAQGHSLEGTTGDNTHDTKLFYQNYFNHSMHAVENVTRVIHELLYNVSKAQYDDGETIEVVSLRSEARAEGAAESFKVTIRSRTGIQFAGNRGFYYGTVRALHIKDAEKLFEARPEWMIRVFYLAAKNNVHLSHRVQKALRRNLFLHDPAQYSSEIRQKMADQFKELLMLDQSIDYAILRMHRFKLLDGLIPGYGAIRGEFLFDDQQYTADILTIRATELLERFFRDNSRPFRNVGESYKIVRANPVSARTLRLAILLRNVVELEVKEAGHGMEGAPLLEQYRKKVAAHLQFLGWDKDASLVAQVTWLIYFQHFLSQRDFLTRTEKVPAVEFLLLAMREFLKDKDIENPDLLEIYHRLYAMTVAVRVAHTAPEHLSLLLREGTRSSMASLDMMFGALHDFLFVSKKPDVGSDEIGHALTRRYETLRNGESGARLGQLQHLMQVIQGHDFSRLLENYLVLADKTNKDLLRATLQKTLRDPGALKALYQRYIQHVSFYYETDRTPEEILQQLMQLAHLEWSQAQKDEARVAMLATSLAGDYDQAYELIFSHPLNEPGVLAIFARVLYENGFMIENIAPRKYGDNSTTTVFLGAFPYSKGDAREILQHIQDDLSFIFLREPLLKHDTLIHRVADQFREMLGKGNPARHWTELKFERANDRYQKELTVSRPTGWRQQPTDVFIATETQGELAGLSRIVFTSTDRQGLFAALTEMFAGKLFGFKSILNIKGFRFDNTNYAAPRVFFWVEEIGNPGKPISASVENSIKAKLPDFFDRITGFTFKQEEKGSSENPPTSAEKKHPSKEIEAQSTTPVSLTSSHPPSEEWIEADFLVANPKGIHAGPVSLLETIVKQHQPKRAILKTTNGEFDVFNTLSMLGSAVVQGQKVMLRFEGLPEKELQILLNEAMTNVKDGEVPVFKLDGKIRNVRSELREPTKGVQEAKPSDIEEEMKILKRHAQEGIARVLIVEDRSEVSGFLNDAIKGWKKGAAKVSVTVVRNGEAGLDMATHGDYDLVWSDFNIPGKNGAEMATAIHAVKPELPIVLWSGNIVPEEMFSRRGKGSTPEEKAADQLLERGIIVRVLGKPVEFSMIKFTLKEMDQHVKAVAQKKLDALRSALPPVAQGEETSALAEVQSDQPIVQEVTRPLDPLTISIDEAAKVQNIFIVGHQGQNYAQLSYDVKHFGIFVPLLLKKFPNAKIHIAADYPNLFAAKRFSSRVVPVRDSDYLKGTEPQTVEPTSVPRGTIADVIAQGHAEKFATWLTDQGCDMVFDFTRNGESLQGALLKMSEQERKKPVAERRYLPAAFIHMSPLAGADAPAGNVPKPVVVIDANKPQGSQLYHVKGTETASTRKTPQGKPPKHWEMIKRVFRELGLWKDKMDLQDIDLQQLGLDELEKEGVKKELEGMLRRTGLAEPDIQEVMKNGRKFIYVNVFSHSEPELGGSELWVPMLSWILKNTNAVLFFASSGPKDQARHAEKLEPVLVALKAMHPEALKRIVSVTPDLSVDKVIQLMRVMDLVMTPDHSGFSDMATVLNVRQFQVASTEDSPTTTYRKNSRVVTKGSAVAAVSEIEAMFPKQYKLARSRILASNLFQRALVIDDTESVRNVSQVILQRAVGIPNVDVAVNGQDALEKVTSDHDLIVCDIEMPVMDGPEFFERLMQRRKDERQPMPSFLFISGDGANKSKIAEHIQGGRVAFLQKPVGVVELQAMVHKLAQSQSQTDQGSESGMTQRAELRQLELQGSTPEARAELRFTKDLTTVETGMPTERLEAVRWTAHEVEDIFSETAIEALIPGESIDKRAIARAWIASQLIKDAPESGISNKRLEKLLTMLMNSVSVAVKAAVSASTAPGPQIQANLFGITEKQLMSWDRDLAVFLGMLVGFRATFSGNVDLNAATAKRSELRIYELARKHGIALAEGQFRLVPAQGDNFFASFRQGDSVAAFVARDEDQLPRVNGARSTYWVTGDKSGGITVIEAWGIVLLRTVSDLKPNLEIQHADHYRAILDLVRNAIQGYLKLSIAA